MMYAENLKVYSDYSITGILDMEMIVQEGKHGRLTLRGNLAGDVTSSVGEGNIMITMTEDAASVREEILFQGVIRKSHVYVENGVKQIILTAETADGEMDREKHSRSFQDPALTYADIVQEILAGYGGALQCKMPAVKIGKPVIQYEETDWEFCRRMAGSMGLGIFSHVDTNRPNLTAGFMEGREAEFRTDTYLCGVDESYYRKGETQGASRPDYLYYQVSAEKYYRIGDYAWYKDRKQYIYETEAVLENEELVFTYRLGSQCRFRGIKQPDKKLAGLALPGQVERTEKESVYLKLDIDGAAGKAAYPFTWAPVTGSISYCMPKVGTKAYLYFPDCYEQEALVIGSTRTNGAAGCFGKLQNRELVTEHGKQLQLHGGTLGFIGGTLEGRQQTLLGSESLCMQAGAGRFVLRSAQDICFQAPKVTMRTPLAINQHRTGQKVKGNPATGGTATSITSQYEFSISSPLGELIGTEYEEYNPFENEISYELYEDVENRRLTGLAAGILTALAIGAIVGIVVFTGGAALGVALGIGAIVAGVGSLASAATYMQDKENNRASDVGTYINNAGTASLITTAIIAMFFGAPYAAKGLTDYVTQGASLVRLFGRTYTFEQIGTYATWGVNGLFTANGFFQVAELGMFFAGEKELGEETGGRFYDDAKELTEGYAFMIYMLGVPYRSKGGKAETPKTKPPKVDTKAAKVGKTTLNDWKNKTSDLSKQAPIEIPSSATVKVQAKNGYDQITFKWTENGQNYEVRWHTKTPGAPEGQGNTWVVSRVTPGTPTGQVRTEHILVGDTWIPRYQWQDAINAYRKGTATSEQLQLLKDGHWQAP